MTSPFFNGFVVRTVNLWVIGSSVWFVFGTQSWHIRYASGNSALADVPFRPPTSKQLTSRMPQIVWISSSLNSDSFHWFLMRFTIISWFRFQRAGRFFPWDEKKWKILGSRKIGFLIFFYKKVWSKNLHWFSFNYQLPFKCIAWRF